MRRSPKSPEGPTWSSHRAPLDALPGLCGRRLLARSRTAGSITSTTTSAERSTGVSSPEALSAGTHDPVSYTHLRAHETGRNLVCRLLLEKKKNTSNDVHNEIR